MECQACSSGTCKSSVEAESCNTSSILVLQEFEVIEQSVTLNEAIEDFGPAALLLVAVGELDMRMSDGCLLYWQLLETENGRVEGCILPSPVVDKLASNSASKAKFRGSGKVGDQYAFKAEQAACSIRFCINSLLELFIVEYSLLVSLH